MTTWLLVAPNRDDDDRLSVSTWVAEKTLTLAPAAPLTLLGSRAIRASFEAQLSSLSGLSGVAFFGHGAKDKLFDANRPPGTDGPALLDTENVARLRGSWIHAFARWSGDALAKRAVEQGVRLYVGYQRPLDVGWAFPPSAEEPFVALVTCTTLALLAGERDERALRANASRAADAFFEALDTIPDDDRSQGWMWLYALAQQLVDDMVVEGPRS